MDMNPLFDIWAKNAVGKYKIAQQARLAATEIDPTAHPALLHAQRLLLAIAANLEHR